MPKLDRNRGDLEPSCASFLRGDRGDNTRFCGRGDFLSSCIVPGPLIGIIVGDFFGGSEGRRGFSGVLGAESSIEKLGMDARVLAGVFFRLAGGELGG
jgi:hypothetical protein